MFGILIQGRCKACSACKIMTEIVAQVSHCMPRNQGDTVIKRRRHVLVGRIADLRATHVAATAPGAAIKNTTTEIGMPDMLCQFKSASSANRTAKPIHMEAWIANSFLARMSRSGVILVPNDQLRHSRGKAARPKLTLFCYP